MPATPALLERLDLPHYDPSSQSFRSFLRIYERTGIANHWVDYDLVHRLRFHVPDDIADHLDILVHCTRDWPQVKQALLQEHSRWDEKKGFEKQGRDESLLEYRRRFRRWILGREWMGEKRYIQAFIEGLRRNWRCVLEKESAGCVQDLDTIVELVSRQEEAISADCDDQTPPKADNDEDAIGRDGFLTAEGLPGDFDHSARLHVMQFLEGYQRMASENPAPWAPPSLKVPEAGKETVSAPPAKSSEQSYVKEERDLNGSQNGELSAREYSSPRTSKGRDPIGKEPRNMESTPQRDHRNKPTGETQDDNIAAAPVGPLFTEAAAPNAGASTKTAYSQPQPAPPQWRGQVAGAVLSEDDISIHSPSKGNNRFLPEPPEKVLFGEDARFTSTPDFPAARQPVLSSIPSSAAATAAAAIRKQSPRQRSGSIPNHEPIARASRPACAPPTGGGIRQPGLSVNVDPTFREKLADVRHKLDSRRSSTTATAPPAAYPQRFLSKKACPEAGLPRLVEESSQLPSSGLGSSNAGAHNLVGEVVEALKVHM